MCKIYSLKKKIIKNNNYLTAPKSVTFHTTATAFALKIFSKIKINKVINKKMEKCTFKLDKNYLNIIIWNRSTSLIKYTTITHHTD